MAHRGVLDEVIEKEPTTSCFAFRLQRLHQRCHHDQIGVCHETWDIGDAVHVFVAVGIRELEAL
jgi:hypothetical protein